MWRLVVVSFLALGWAFYELSGGSEYEPVENSIQAQARLAPEERMTQGATAGQSAEEERTRRTVAEVEATMDRMGQAEEDTEELTTTLASVRRDVASIIQSEADRPKAELLQLELPETIAKPPSGSNSDIDAAIAAAMGEVIVEPGQVRWVKETMVDLRSGPGLTFDKVTQVTKGTEVAVLEDPGHGWVNVRVMDGYQTGWVAEWLLMQPE
ncbi:MAG: SH3 domain-containing protein [Roseovarius sp.]